MKSMNCISAIGRMPMSAAPEAAPTMAISEIGVSMTRSRTEVVDQPGAGLERAAVDADVLADEEDALVARHLFGCMACADGVDVESVSGSFPVSIAGEQSHRRFFAARHRRALRFVGGGVDFALHALLNARRSRPRVARPLSISSRSKRVTGSFAFHSSIISGGTYDWLSCSAWPFMRNVITSSSVTPPPPRARSTARFAAP